jgi:AcrR family transcriptional regulator
VPAPQSTETSTEPASRPLRADAQRNYDKIVLAAREVFRERGAEGSLDEIARRAGVGPGTLYRHFPTRDALIDTVMRDWSDRINADSEEIALSDLPARAALATWFSKFVENVGIYQGAAAKVMSAMDDPSSPIYRKCQVLVAANDKVLERARESGALRPGVESREVMRLVSGVATVVDQSGIGAAEAEPMLAIVLDGILLPESRASVPSPAAMRS